jgi:hypothetical protein
MHPLGTAVEGSLRDVGAWWRRERSTVLLLLALQVVAFSYLYFLPILTNHTFPNAFLFSYPTFKTRSEGRWMSDLIVWAQGGSGVQAFQMILATLVQACNGLLLADLVGEQRRAQRFLLAALLCLYPAFIDYYAFSVEHLTFVLGDTFAILAALALVRGAPSPARLVLSACGFTLSIACYQPKLGLVALLVASVALLRLARPSPGEAPPRAAAVFRELGTLLLVAAGSVALYWVSMRLTVTEWSPGRTHVNTLSAAWQQAVVAYGETARFYSSGIAGLSRTGHVTVLAILALGICGFAWDAGRRAPWLVPVVLAVVAILPVGLRATYVVNELAWSEPGRILFPFGYGLVLFLARGLQVRLAGVAVGIAGAGLLWSFLVFDTQQANYAAYKSQRDAWWIGRIVDRVEPLAPPAPGGPVPLVVAGFYPELPVDKFIRRPGKGIQLNTPTFETYRQVFILNAFLGRDAFRSPTAAELDRARASMIGRKPWPAAESVYLVEQTVVVLLEEPTSRTEMTWTEG